MNTPVNKTQENTNHRMVSKVPHKPSIGESSFKFIDNRPETFAQQKLHEMANVSQQKSPSAQLHTIANNSSKNSIQKKGIEEEDLLQGKFSSVQQAEPDSSNVLVVQRQDSDAEEDSDQLEPDIEILPEYHAYALLSPDQAKNRCLEAAQVIGAALLANGYTVDYVCVVQWSLGSFPTSTNHYAAIGNGVVFDATAQQDHGMEANITPFGDWLADLRMRSGSQPAELSRFVRGSLAECQRLSVANQAYFWDIQYGEPLLKYSRKKINNCMKTAKKFDKNATEKPLPPYDFENEESDEN